MSWCSAFLITFFIILPKVHSENILWIAGLASPSHQIWIRPLQRALALRGHNITALSVDVDREITPNITFLNMETVYKFHANSSHSYISMMDANPLKTIGIVTNFRSEACIPALQSEGVARLMNYPETFKFDLVIHDFIAAQCLLGFIERFGNPPLISLSASTCPIAISSASGNPQYPSLIPSNQLRQGYNMNVYGMIQNFVLYAYDNIMRLYLTLPHQNELARQHFNNPDLDVIALSRSSVITMINVPPYDMMQPYYQTIIPIAGLHIQPPKELQKSLYKFVEESKDGIIYFALGTNVKPEMFSLRRVQFFVEAFERFPSFRILWKFDPNLLSFSLPENIMMQKWMPQNDILAHSKIKIFIGHGGALSCHEAVWYGVPQLLIPGMIDQKQNAARAVERGIAIKLDYDELSVDSITDALNKLIYDESYKANVTSLSRVFRDQPQKPLDRAIFWTEYVLRNRNNFKLRSPGQNYGTLEHITLHSVLTVIALFFVQLIFVRTCCGRAKV